MSRVGNDRPTPHRQAHTPKRIVAAKVHRALVNFRPDLGEGRIQIHIDPGGRALNQIRPLEMPGEIEKQVRSLGKLPQTSFLDFFTFRQEGGSPFPSDLMEQFFPMGQIHALGETAGLSRWIEDFFFLQGFDQPNLPSQIPQPQSPLEKRPGVTSRSLRKTRQTHPDDRPLFHGAGTNAVASGKPDIFARVHFKFQNLDFLRIGFQHLCFKLVV